MPEVRLIDANTFAEKYGNYYAEEGPEGGFIGTVGELIAKQPTIEAKPVRHGQWIDAHFVSGGDFNRCSECGCYIEKTYFANDYNVRYCPNCGTKMFQSGGVITKERLAEIMTDGTHGDCWFFDTMEDDTDE